MSYRRRGFWLGAIPLLLGLLLPAVAQADVLASSATVTVDERGFHPTNVTIAGGGSVTWQNTGTTSHVVSTANAPIQVTVGVDIGKSASQAFGLPGVYHYTSSTDCSPNVTKALFACLDYTVTVLDQPAGSTLPAAQASPSPAATVVAAAPPGAPVTVDITDTGISPDTVTIPAGGSVNWLNQGFHVHTATTAPGTQSFDTGGLATGQSNTITFPQAGTYSYTSSPDCLPGVNTQQGFNCGPYTLIVTGASSAPASPNPSPVGAVPAASSTTIGIDDANGFQPNVLTIKLGQSVTWANKGNNVHAVVSDPGVIPAFDSGGIGAGQSFTWTPTVAGQYTYHSPPDATYYTSTTCNCPAPAYSVFSGTVVVGL